MGGVQYAPRWLYSAQKDPRGALHYQSELSRSDQPWNYPTANIPSFQLRPQFSSETWALVISVLDQDTLEHSRRCTNGSAHLRMKQSAWRTCALRYRLKSALESSAGGGGGGTASSMNLSRNAKLLSLRPAGSLEASFSTRSCSRLPCELQTSLGQSAAWAALAG